MQVKNTLIKLVVAAAVMLPYAVSAQTSSINAFSPYTMYGIGEINTPGTTQMRSMGGVGVAMGTPGKINLLNPAAYSTIPQKSFLFSFGLEGQNYYNSQKVDNVSKNTAYNTFNFHDIAFQMPVAKKLGLGFSLTPYSSVGYRTKYTQDFDPNDPVWGNVGRVQYVYQGEGDVTEVKVGLGWEIFKNFSLGVAAQYYWGDIDRSFVMTPTPITGDGTFSSTVGSDNYSISSIKGQVGVLLEGYHEPETHADVRCYVRFRRQPESRCDLAHLYRRPVQLHREGRYDPPGACFAASAFGGGLLYDLEMDAWA